MLRLTSLSFAHPAVPADRRARLVISKQGIDDAHARLRSIGHGAFVLSTCLRIEIAWAGGAEAGPEVLRGLYGDNASLEHGTVRSDDGAFVHLSRVAAGLDSPMVGETEVLSQFRHAVSVMPPDATDLARMMNAAVGVGRTTRRLLGEAPRGSLGAVAASLAATSGPVAILGSGAMARAAAENLDRGMVTVFARRTVEVASLPTLPWEQAAEAIATFPVVISTVPGNGCLFPANVIARALGSRTEPLLLIDLGMPPAFDPGQLSGVRYLGVDQVASTVNTRPSNETEERIVRGASAVWHRLTVPDRVGAVIAGMMAQADTAVSEEVQRFVNRLSVSDDPERVLAQLAHSVARRVLHPPIAYVSTSDRGIEVAEALADAFGLERSAIDE